MYNNDTTKTKKQNIQRMGKNFYLKNPSFHFKMIYFFYLFFHFFSKTTNQSTNKNKYV